jgi:hypothetical protein
MAITDKVNILLDDPGLAENSELAEHCVQACFQMIFRTKRGGEVPSFGELDRLMNKRPGKYTYEFALLAEMPARGFETRIVWGFDLHRLISDPAQFLLEHYGPAVGAETIRNTDLKQLQQDAARLVDSKSVVIEKRPATRDDLTKYIREGFYVMCTVNQRVLQADPDYVAHNILVFGYSNRGVTIHNPGPPSVKAAEITWDLFDRAWAYPSGAARNILAFRS